MLLPCTMTDHHLREAFSGEDQKKFLLIHSNVFLRSHMRRFLCNSASSNSYSQPQLVWNIVYISNSTLPVKFVYIYSTWLLSIFFLSLYMVLLGPAYDPCTAIKYSSFWSFAAINIIYLIASYFREYALNCCYTWKTSFFPKTWNRFR